MKTFLKFQNRKMLSEIYNLKDEKAKGRLISLGSSLMTSFYNVFITGIFYTGFLSMYDISITGVGIISFIPNLACVFHIFSSLILEKIKKRKAILIASKIYFYAMYILATMIMPLFVTDSDARVVWFAILIFLAYAVYALFSPGFTPWFYSFYPEDNEKRGLYISYNQIFSSIMSSVVLLSSGILADMVSGSPFQKQLILGFRYFAFVLVLIDVYMQSQAKEYPYPKAPKVQFKQIFTLPFQYKKYMNCVYITFAWNLISGFNSGLWNYHLLNHMEFSYTLINLMAVIHTVILVVISPWWRKFLQRYSWIKTFGLCMLAWIPTEILAFFMNQNTVYLYVFYCLLQNVLSVGLNLSYANIIYIHLPSENSTVHFSFHAMGVNLFAFLGLWIGTQVSGITGDVPWMIGNFTLYSVQFTTLMRAAGMLILGLILVKNWRNFSREDDIANVEAQDEMAKRKRLQKRLAK